MSNILQNVSYTRGVMSVNNTLYRFIYKLKTKESTKFLHIK